MKKLLKYILPVALAALFGSIFHSIPLAVCTIALTCAMVYFDFFNRDRAADYKASPAEKVFSIFMLVLFLGSAIGQLVSPHAYFAYAFNVCFCAFWSAWMPKLFAGILRERY